MVASKRRASSSAAADLPLAVGPAMRRARRGRRAGPTRPPEVMPSIPVVVTLVAAPQSFEISDALIARAAQALPRAIRYERLAEGAADLFFEGDIEDRKSV